MSRRRVLAFLHVAGTGGGHGVGRCVHVRGTEHRHDEQVNPQEDLAERQRTEQHLHRRFTALLRQDARHINGPAHELVHAVAFQRAEEEPAAKTAAHQHRGDHFFHLAALGHTGHKHGHARCVGNPPQPVENRPVAGEGTITLRVGKQAHVYVVLHHQANGIGGVVDDELRGANQQHHAGKHQRADTHHLRQTLHATGNTDVGTEREHHRHHTDHHQLGGEGIRHAGQRRQAAGQGGGGEHQGYGQGAKHGQQKHQVDDPPYWPLGLETGDGFDDRRQAQAALFAHMEVICHRQRRQGVQRPGTDPPMEERITDAVIQRFSRACGNVQTGRLVVIRPLHHAPVQGRRAHARADKHEHPGDRRVFGFAVTQADVAVLAERDIQHHQGAAKHEHLHRSAKGTGGQLEQHVGGGLGLLRKEGKACNGGQYSNQAS